MEFNQQVSDHADSVTDISFDFYGRRFASCSSDNTIKVWSRVTNTDEWEPQSIERAHTKGINRLSWAHPEYGQVIASCSDDKTVKVFEEQEKITGNGNRRWVQKAEIKDSKSSVNDVKFAPKVILFMKF